MSDHRLRSTRQVAVPYPQEQKLDVETVRRWRSEAITTSAPDRLWLNRCEALCNALLAEAGLEARRDV